MPNNELAIQWGFNPPERPQMSKSVLNNSAVRLSFLSKNNPKNLEPSFETALDFWDCFGGENPSHISE